MRPIKQLKVNSTCTINYGILKGCLGLIVGYNCLEDEVIIQIDDVTQVIIASEYVNQ